MKGIDFARSSAASDKGPQFEWVEVRSKKKVRVPSPVPVRKIFKRIVSELPPSKPPALQKSSVFSRLDLGGVPDSALVHHPSRRVWVPRFHLCSSPLDVQNGGDHGIDLSLNLGASRSPDRQLQRSFAQVVSQGPPPLSGANCVPLGPAQRPLLVRPRSPRPASGVSSGSCSRCFSTAHLRSECGGRIRCSACFRLGHINSLCRFPPRFPRLSANPLFSNQIKANGWEGLNVSRRFGLGRPLPPGPSCSSVPIC